MDVCEQCEHCCINGRCLSEEECSKNFTALFCVVVLLFVAVVTFFFRRKRNQFRPGRIDDGRSMLSIDKFSHVQINSISDESSDSEGYKNFKKQYQNRSFNHQVDSDDDDSLANGQRALLAPTQGNKSKHGKIMDQWSGGSGLLKSKKQDSLKESKASLNQSREKRSHG